MLRTVSGMAPVADGTPLAHDDLDGLASALTGASPRPGARLGVLWSRQPRLPGGCDHSNLEDAGVSEIRLTEPVALTKADPLATLEFIRLLREAMAAGIQVRWRGSADATFDLGCLFHLPPPQAAHGTDTPPAMAAWRAAYRFGRCYYRRGPGFVQVKDVRVAGRSARFLLDEPDWVEVFDDYLEPRPAPVPSSPRVPILRSLEQERLVLTLGGLAITLPFRMRTWPVPHNAV